ncbi:MAG: dTDP-4-dehydrorhamnose reductase [Euryarchaeota archaeon]|nr:dTDP-4-dehydrorhamnose reductase [Euryarchaeota archaeon]
MKILITGASGLLGSKIVELNKDRYEIIPTHSTQPFHPNSVKMDIIVGENVLQVFNKFRPNVVIHTAAETNVDRCESYKNEAWKVNVEGTRNIAEACKNANAKLIFISTDYIFNGEKGLYNEEDKPNPINYYGLTKLKGEEIVRAHCEDYIIARPSVLYGWHLKKTNYVTWVINSLKQGKRIDVVEDHYNSPTLADNLAEAVLRTIETDANGTYHIAGSERINRCDFALKIAEAFKLDKTLINSIKMEDLKVWIAKRPKDSSLSVDKAQKELKVGLLNVKEGLVKMKKRENSEKCHL